jgi:CarD family transcriptional regulator
MKIGFPFDIIKAHKRKGALRMYEIGEKVLYGIHGVCRISDTEERLVDRVKRQYLVLEPVDQTGAKFYVPTHNAAALAKLRPLLSRETLESLLRSEDVKKDAWIEDENARKQAYRELIHSGDRTALIRMVGSLHRHKEAQALAGRKFHLCDENFLRDAEKILSAEFSLVLDIAPGQVSSYVWQVMNEE